MKSTRKLLALLLAIILTFSSATILVHAETADLSESGTKAEAVETGAGSVESAINWAVSIANDDSHGYSQSRRYGPDYDCASLVCTAFRQAGFSVSQKEVTSTMKNAFVDAGFTWIPASSFTGFPTNTNGLKRGDILLADGHTALYLGNDQMVHARGGYIDKFDEGYSGDQTGEEIAVTSYYASGYSKVGGWQGVLRYESIAPVDIGTKFYGNIVATETQTKDVVTTGASDGLAETGAGTYSSIPSLRISRVMQTPGTKDCHWCSMLTVVGYALGTYEYNGTSTNYRIVGKDYEFKAKNDSLSKEWYPKKSSQYADSNVSTKFPVTMGRDSKDSDSAIGNNDYTYKIIYNELKLGRPVSVYAIGNSDHASVVIGYKENSNKTLTASGFIVLEVKKDGQWWSNSTDDYNDYANNPQTDVSSGVSHMSCYVTLDSWLRYGGSNKEIKTICYPTEIKDGPANQTYEDIGTKFYANIVPTGASTLAVTATSDEDVKLGTLNYNDYQKWYFERQSDKSYKITNVKTKLCLDLSNSNTANGTNISVYKSNNGNNQRWYFVKNDSGYWIVPKCSTGSAMDIKGASLKDGTNIQEYTQNNSTAQRFSVNKIYNIAYDPNGGTGSVAGSSVSYNQKFTIKENAFSKPGYSFAGYYYVNRKSDNTWFVADKGWVKASSYQNEGLYRRQYEVDSYYYLNSTWTNGAADNDTFTFYPQWKCDSPALQFYGNYSGYNYIIGGSFEAITSSVYPHGSDNVYSLTADSANRLNNQNSMKIVGKSAGNSANDVRFYTDTARSIVNSNSAGDNKRMTLGFWAKSSVDNVKAYFRWGNISTTKNITLTKDWQFFKINMTKNPYASPEVCLYFDKAGTFYINSPTLVDGATDASRHESETVGTITNDQEYAYGGKYSWLPTPERDGYTFDGWFTAKQGGTQITEDTDVYENEMRVYAHWTKDISYTPIKTIEANGHKYELYDNAMGWEQAESFCETLGGHLITIDSVSEQSLAYQMIKDRMNFSWIGLKFYVDEGQWRWVTGDQLTYKNWATQNEGKDDTTEYYAIMYPYNYGTLYSPGTWADCNGVDANRSFYGWPNSSFICEYDTIYPDFIELNESDISLNVGETFMLTATLEPENANRKITWTSDNDDIAIVDEEGVVMAKSEGVTWISARTVNGLITRCKVTVTDSIIYPEDIELSAYATELYVDETEQLYATVVPKGASQEIMWYSEDESIATVDDNGLIHAKGIGTTWIHAQTADESVETTCTVIVLQTDIDPDHVEWNGFTGYIKEDGTICLDEYNGDETDLVIPSEIDGIKVTEIKSINNLDFIESLIIPETVKTIGPDSFSNCSNLFIVSIEGAETIGMYAFMNCDNLGEVFLPRTLKTIRYGAFVSCPELRRVIIPDSVTRIEKAAFGFVLEPEGESGYRIVPSEKYTVYGYSGTVAEEYAEKNGFGFVDVSEPIVFVDPYYVYELTPNEDGSVTVDHVTKALWNPNEKEIEIDSEVPWFYSQYPDDKELVGKAITGLGDYALCDFDSIERVVIPESIVSIGYHAIGYYIDDENAGEANERKLENLTIVGYSGTAAETYAEENGFTFVSLDEPPTTIVLRGDTDGDGMVSILDATAIQRRLAELPTQSYNEKAADADGDGEVSIFDATAIQRFLAGFGNPHNLEEAV